MADYLSSIVARASQATPSLSPRVPSLFEPPPTLLSVPLHMLGPGPRRTTSPAVRERAPAPDVRVSEPQAPATALPGANTRPVRQQALELDVTVDLNEGVAKGETPTGEPPARTARPSPNRSEPRGPEPALDAMEQETESTVRPLVARAHPRAASPLPAMLEPAPIRNPPAQANEREDPAPAVIAALRTEPSLRDAIQAVPTTNVPLTPQRPADAVRQPPRAVAAPSLELETQRPVVNVVIERLSVQAITSPSAPPRSSAPAPAPSMSLEQYLQRRSTRS
jgi:hypothetical protein